MITGWMIFGACALIAILTAESLEGKKQKKARSNNYTEEDLNKEIMERNNRMMEEARKKGLAA